MADGDFSFAEADKGSYVERGLIRPGGSVAQLAEEDAESATKAKPDANGNDCYVAAVTSLADKLGNAYMPDAMMATAGQSLNFGVDKTPPVIEDVEFDDGDIFSDLAAIRVPFEVQNPKLASGDDGAAVLDNNMATGVYVPDGKDDDKDPDRVGDVDFDLSTDDDATAGVAGLVEGSHTVTIQVADAAVRANVASTTASFLFDMTAPTFSGLRGTAGPVSGGRSVSINVSGAVTDTKKGVNAVAGVDSVFFAVRTRDVAPDFYTAGDPPIAKARFAPKKITGGGPFDEPLTIPSPVSTAMNEQLCVTVMATDKAGNETGHHEVTRFEVDWGAGMTIGDLSEDTISQKETSTFTMMLDTEPSGPVTVSIASSDATAATAERSEIEFVVSGGDGTATHDWSSEVTVTLSGVQDEDPYVDDVTFTVSARGGSYDGVSDTRILTVTDADWLLTSDAPTGMTEGDTVEVTYTVTRSETSQATAKIDFVSTGNSVTINDVTDKNDPPVDLTTATLAFEETTTAGVYATTASVTVTIIVEADKSADTTGGTVTATLSGSKGMSYPTKGIVITVNDGADPSPFRKLGSNEG